MKKMITAAITAGLTASMAMAADVTLDFASAYVFRGVTQNDEAVFQPAIETSGLGVPEEYGSVTVGAWGNYDIGDYDDNKESSEFSEVDWYVSYSLPAMVENLDIFIGYTEYTYPNGGTADKEGNFGLGYAIGDLGLGATVYFNIGGGGLDEYIYYEFAAEYGFDITEELSASIAGTVAGYSKDEGDDGLNDGTITGALSYTLSEVWSVGLSGTYIAQLDDDVLVDEDLDNGQFGYDVEFLGMLSLAASF
ncbi:MAG TPA: hypothetical protein VLL07_02485 [Pontiella sp.]|nr:hypothetical protein [Pontiella sp.]